MEITNFPSCCNAKILHDLTDDYDGGTPTAAQVKARLNQLKPTNNIVVAISADHQGIDATMKAGGFKKVGNAKRRTGYITLWAWLNPVPKKAKKKARARR